MSKFYPEWFRLGNRLFWIIPYAVYDYLREDYHDSLDNQSAVICSDIHFIHCLNLSVETNRKGQHAVAICLLRQCVEALTIIELGLLQETDISSPLLTAWRERRKTSGEIRKELQEKVWPRYGTGLWNEPWHDFIGEFSKALHPYAHYSSDLLEWQTALVADAVKRTEDGSYRLLAKVGLDTYDGNKATRVTLLHILLIFVLGRIVVENRILPGIDKNSVMDLGKALSESEELCDGKLNWHQQFWAHEFTKPE